MSFNDYPDVSAPDPPFGRIRNKRSGYGKELSNLGIEKSVDRKLVLMQTSPSKVQAMKEINRMVANMTVSPRFSQADNFRVALIQMRRESK
jgi:hypothetical protein